MNPQTPQSNNNPRQYSNTPAQQPYPPANYQTQNYQTSNQAQAYRQVPQQAHQSLATAYQSQNNQQAYSYQAQAYRQVPQQALQKQPRNAKNIKLPGPAINENPNSTQSTLLISELRDGMVIMKDGSFRAVIACKSINFDLMSENEREGVEYSYQNFLNSLEFPTQILIRSQRVDIGPYLARLTELRKNNDNMLLGILMDDYINFIDILSQEANIMDKSFFIVIPYYSSPDAEKMVQQSKNIFATFRQNDIPTVTKINRDTYDKATTEIKNRVDSVINGLFQIGIHSVRLNTRELSELYYNFNNPDTAVREPFIDFNKMATTYVRKGDAPQKGVQ